MSFEDVLKFWFVELQPEDWFQGSPETDKRIRERFEKPHHAAANGEFYSWRSSPQGRLAEVIVLDQFSRNIYRNKSMAFAFDNLALFLAQESIHCGDHKKLSSRERSFLYMPFMHSESRIIHEVAIQLFSEPGLENNLDFELRHKKIIDKFGRYPHRNKILGRPSTDEEIEFLKLPGSSF